MKSALQLASPDTRAPASKYMYIYGGAIGDALLGVHLGRTLAAAVPGTHLTLISTRTNPFVRELAEPIHFVSVCEMPKEKIRSWWLLFRLFCTPHCAVYMEPLSGPVPLWWRFIVYASTFRQGSISVCCTPHVRVAKRHEHVVPYSPRNDRMFDLVPKVLHEWGVAAPVLKPHLAASLYQNSAPLPRVPYLVLHFFAPSTRRSVPVVQARELLTLVKEAFPSHTLILTCTKKELERAERIAADMHVEIRHDLSPSALISLFAGADAYVGVDTGVTHLACHLGVPCVVLGNRSNPCWLPYYAPRATVIFDSKRCICNGDKTDGCFEETPEGPVYRCLFDIEPKLVVEKLRDFIVR